MEFENGEAKAPLKQIVTAKGDNGTQNKFYTVSRYFFFDKI